MRMEMDTKTKANEELMKVQNNTVKMLSEQIGGLMKIIENQKPGGEPVVGSEKPSGEPVVGQGSPGGEAVAGEEVGRPAGGPIQFNLGTPGYAKNARRTQEEDEHYEAYWAWCQGDEDWDWYREHDGATGDGEIGATESREPNHQDPDWLLPSSEVGKGKKGKKAIKGKGPQMFGNYGKQYQCQ